MNLLQMSFAGGIMILMIVVVRAVLINKLPKKTFLVLWGIVLLRLLLPFTIPSVFSAYSIMAENTPAQQNSSNETKVNFIPAAPSVERMSTVSLPAAEAPAQSHTAIPFWLIIWAAGMVSCVTFFSVSYYRCRREFRMSLPAENEYTKAWLSEHELRRRLSIRRSGRIMAPLTYGIIKPVILMPKDTEWGNMDQLKYVLAHELVHIRRFDAVTKLFLILVLCIHWFNPLVWVMYILSNRDLELSCDETVIRNFGEKTKKAYAFTLISMEETQSKLTPLCNNFSKNAIEERITAIMKIKKISWIAIFAAVCLVTGVTTVFATSAANRPAVLQPVPETDFTDEEYAVLASFQFPGYEDMKVSQYQEKVWKLRDTSETMQLLERFSQNEQFYGLKDTNETASFYFNILEPLTAENWKTRDFSGYASSDFKAADNATAEYFLSMTILDAGKLTVREYNKARIGVFSSLQKFMENKTAEELQDEASMKKKIETEIDRLVLKYGSERLQLSIEYFYQPLSVLEDTSGDLSQSKEEGYVEPRQNGNGTKEDYESLLKLRTGGYQKLSVEKFNAALLDWGNEHFDASERIMEDVLRQDYQVKLTEEERSFVEITFVLSNEENYRLIKSMRTGEPEEAAWYGGVSFTKESEDGGAWCNLYYQLSYRISDKSKLTVTERDRRVGGVIREIQKFWNDTGLEELLQLNENDMVSKLKKLADDNSNDLVTIYLDNGRDSQNPEVKRISFEYMDERESMKN